MDYDKVAVFEGGKVVEFDSPQDCQSRLIDVTTSHDAGSTAADNERFTLFCPLN